MASYVGYVAMTLTTYSESNPNCLALSSLKNCDLYRISLSATLLGWFDSSLSSSSTARYTKQVAEVCSGRPSITRYRPCQRNMDCIACLLSLVAMSAATRPLPSLALARSGLFWAKCRTLRSMPWVIQCQDVWNKVSKI